MRRCGPLGFVGVALLLGAAGGVYAPGCVLSPTGKTSCRDSGDCIEARICIDNECSDAACGQLCLRECDAAAECGVPGLEDCVTACDEGTHFPLNALPKDESSCKTRWVEGQAPVDCDGRLCELHCDALCLRGSECGHIEDIVACREGCVANPPAECNPTLVSTSTCDAIAASVSCAEAQGILGADVDCNDLPCSDEYDCASSQLCDYNRCLTRCTEDWECPAATCYLGEHCSDPVGTPCDPDEYGSCGGPSCINVDADDRTTSDFYCTLSCYSEACPSGYVCFDNECRRCTGGC